MAKDFLRSRRPSLKEGTLSILDEARKGTEQNRPARMGGNWEEVLNRKQKAKRIKASRQEYRTFGTPRSSGGGFTLAPRKSGGRNLTRAGSRRALNAYRRDRGLPVLGGSSG